LYFSNTCSTKDFKIILNDPSGCISYDQGKNYFSHISKEKMKKEEIIGN